MHFVLRDGEVYAAVYIIYSRLPDSVGHYMEKFVSIHTFFFKKKEKVLQKSRRVRVSRS